MKVDISTEGAILYRKTVFGSNSNGYDDILQVITGLDASAGAVVYSNQKSALFVDGRYSLAARQYVDTSKFEILGLRNEQIVQWIEKNLPQNSKISYDPRYYTHESIDFFISSLKDYDFQQIDLKKTLNISTKKIDLNIYHLNKKNNKLSCVIEMIKEHNLDGYLICDPCTIAWLLDIRDLNQKYTPVTICYLLITKYSEQCMYLDEQYNSYDNFKYENEIIKDIFKFSRIGIDKSETPSCIKCRNLVSVKNPCLLHRSIKNDEEINDIKVTAQKDSTAIIKFLYWFHNTTEKITELDAEKKMLYFRKQEEGFIGESFRTIAAADENASIIHYSPTPSTNKIINNIFLIDSGGQYKNGTTDITRTISKFEPSSEEKLFYTLVLKGHIALANAKFPPGTGGAHLDSLARQFLWQYNQDYNHSTGHGIGYLSHVHEGPVAISSNNNIPIQAGMIFSNEPGYYQDNDFGIRLENMMLVMNKNFLFFETISLVPFDHKFIDRNLLTEVEIHWLRRYNKSIVNLLNIEKPQQTWLVEYYLKDYL